MCPLQNHSAINTDSIVFYDLLVNQKLSYQVAWGSGYQLLSELLKLLLLSELLQLLLSLGELQLSLLLGVLLQLSEGPESLLPPGSTLVLD